MQKVIIIWILDTELSNTSDKEGKTIIIFPQL